MHEEAVQSSPRSSRFHTDAFFSVSSFYFCESTEPPFVCVSVCVQSVTVCLCTEVCFTLRCSVFCLVRITYTCSQCESVYVTGKPVQKLVYSMHMCCIQFSARHRYMHANASQCDTQCTHSTILHVHGVLCAVLHALY